MSAWPAEIEKYGETFRFKAERPGWLVYENEEHIILVGRKEAVSLCREHEERAMSDEEAMLRALADVEIKGRSSLERDGSAVRVTFGEIVEAGFDEFRNLLPDLAPEEVLPQALAALRPLLAAREAAVRAEERERCARDHVDKAAAWDTCIKARQDERAKFETVIRAAHEAFCYAAPLAPGTDSEAIFLRGRKAVHAAAAAAGASGDKIKGGL